MQLRDVVETGVAARPTATGRARARLEGPFPDPSCAGSSLDLVMGSAAATSRTVTAVVAPSVTEPPIVVGRTLLAPHPIRVAIRPDVAVTDRSMGMVAVDIP